LVSSFTAPPVSLFSLACAASSISGTRHDGQVLLHRAALLDRHLLDGRLQLVRESRALHPVALAGGARQLDEGVAQHAARVGLLGVARVREHLVEHLLDLGAYLRLDLHAAEQRVDRGLARLGHRRLALVGREAVGDQRVERVGGGALAGGGGGLRGAVAHGLRGGALRLLHRGVAGLGRGHATQLGLGRQLEELSGELVDALLRAEAEVAASHGGVEAVHHVGVERARVEAELLEELEEAVGGAADRARQREAAVAVLGGQRRARSGELGGRTRRGRQLQRRDLIIERGAAQLAAQLGELAGLDGALLQLLLGFLVLGLRLGAEVLGIHLARDAGLLQELRERLLDERLRIDLGSAAYTAESAVDLVRVRHRCFFFPTFGAPVAITNRGT
jgi:hypothetical protein